MLFINDTILISAFHDGDITAENALFIRFFKPLCLYADGIIHHIHQSEDLVTEVFIKLFERRSNFPNIPAIRSFLYKSVRNAALNYIEKVKLHRIEHGNIGYLSQKQDETAEVHATEMLRMEILQEIYLEIEGLPDKCGQIFKMIFIKGMSTDQIAQVLSLSRQTVRTQKARAISLIRTNLLKKQHILPLLYLFYLLLRGPR